MLQIDNLSVAYGGISALKGVTIDVQAGEFVAVVGPNGAGKTTLFKSISGTVPASGGRITFDGIDLLAVPPPARPALGVAHVPEGRQVFKSMSVIDNLIMGSYPRPTRKSEWSRILERLFTLFPILAERSDQLAGTLSGGEQQMLAIARGLAGRPRLLLLDEPSMGLAPKIADAIFERISNVHQQEKTTIVLVEQRVIEAFESCDRGYVIESGKVVLSGNRDLLMNNPTVKRAYLGL